MAASNDGDKQRLGGTKQVEDFCYLWVNLNTWTSESDRQQTSRQHHHLDYYQTLALTPRHHSAGNVFIVDDPAKIATTFYSIATVACGEEAMASTVARQRVKNA